MSHTEDTIIAISTPPGIGALGVVRLSGPQAIALVSQIFSRPLTGISGHQLVYGQIHEAKGELLDEVVVGVFRAPRSVTREDVVEISCHGSPYILRRVMEELVDAGARPAARGEFTQRAFLNGAMDLAQAEAVADLIAAGSAGAHRLAIDQLRGGVSQELKALREELLNFTSLIELELDFGEEDVEFADRGQLTELIERLGRRLDTLTDSFRLGNALKQGVPTVILGKPNAGKSTLLNSLLNDNRAIVSDIPGTTRDVIEDRLVIGGVEFRLMDTAGVRDTLDLIEAEGVSRSLQLAQTAQLLLYVFDATTETPTQARDYLQGLDLPAHTEVVLLANKIDLLDASTYPDSEAPAQMPAGWQWFGISAKTGSHLDAVTQWMVEVITDRPDDANEQAIISNVRHLHALQRARSALHEVEAGMDLNVSGDLLAIDIRTVLHHIGEITGQISTEEVLGNIFGKFCIGK
jgi:tRNA modification GTPase